MLFQLRVLDVTVPERRWALCGELAMAQNGYHPTLPELTKQLNYT